MVQKKGKKRDVRARGGKNAFGYETMTEAFSACYIRISPFHSPSFCRSRSLVAQEICEERKKNLVKNALSRRRVRALRDFCASGEIKFSVRRLMLFYMQNRGHACSVSVDNSRRARLVFNQCGRRSVAELEYTHKDEKDSLYSMNLAFL